LLNKARNPSTTSSEGPLCRGTNRSGPERCSGKVIGLIARKRPRLLRITGTLIEPADDLRHLRVDQARRIELLVRIVLVAPAVGETLVEAAARDLMAQLGRQTAAGLAGAAATASLISRSSACMSAGSERVMLPVSFISADQSIGVIAGSTEQAPGFTELSDLDSSG
jgi:hypothetical protein